ncbi:MAG: hypothetical protein J1G04_07140, partial [Clostridiales bacterium]|nr:hypothetical protein [Clostridiales bacterium]
ATVTANAFGFELAVTPTLSADKEKLVGAVASVSSKTTTEGGVTTVNTIGTLRASLVEISEETTVISVPDDDYLQAVDYIQPILNLVNDISAAKTVKLDLSAAITLSESDITVTCDDITISIEDSVSVSATLDIGNDVAIEVVYKNDVIYLRLANLVDGVVDSDHNIAVSLDMTTDLIRLNDVLSQYLPEYLSDELSKILASSDGDEDAPSAFDKLGLIINGFKAMADTPTVDSILNGLFAPLSAIYDHSAVYYMLDMVSLKGVGGEAVVSANILGLTLNLTPTLSEDRTELLGATASISSDKGQVGAIDVSFSEISEASTIIALPSDEYVPLIEYVELINNLINTFTTATGESVDDVLGGSKPNEDKTYTFEIPELTSPIVYKEKALDENGNVLRNPDGTAQVSNTITISSTGQSLLRGKIAVPAKDSAVDSHGIADTKAKIEIEAHVKLSISKLKDTYGDITLDLYIINGEAYLKYVEGKSGYGETVSIDYDSVMQILASVMNIVGVDSEIVNSVFGSYNQDIDTSMFKSLKIAGFDGIQKTASELAAAVESIKTALGELKTAWSIVKNCLSIDELGTKLDELSFHFDAAMDAVKSISFGETKPADTDLFKKIIGGIKLGVTEAIDGEKTLYADVDNSITVDEAFEFGASPTARVSVTETTDREKNIIKGIRIENLDVKTALLDGGITFKAGDEVDDFTVTLPDGLLDRGNEKHTYSDLSNIKYLLYDIMNTANLMEFDISGVNTSDVINVKMKLIGLDMINFDIHYNVKVKIFTKDELKAIGLPVKESDPEIKTMAYVELYYKNCKFATSSLIPDCTTKLYFFDDMLYVDGVRMYLETTTGLFGIKTTTQKSERVLCKYTTEQFGYMVSNDIGKFLEEFLFYLVPLTKRVSSILTVDIQQIIIDNVTKESKTDLSNKTIAKVFKGYSYNAETGKHDLTIGLKELAGNSALGDLNVSFTGANDGDNNLLDNYLQSAYIGTNIGVTGVAVELKLNATLRNVGVVSDGGVDKIRSTWTDGNERAFLNNCITQIIPNTAWVDIWAGVA